jgi:hypothetical protein
LRWIIRRCVRGFHAALYREPLDDAAQFSSCPPLPEARMVDGRAEVAEVAPVVREYVKELKRNRLVGTIDRVVCRNGKCRYECVWTQADNGRRACVFGFDLYGWIDLGDPQLGQRGCSGSYVLPEARVPASATLATRLVVPFENRAPLDPFGD